jgi:hypothetical protein
VEYGERRFGPYAPIGGPIPLHRYRAFKKTPTQRRAELIDTVIAKDIDDLEPRLTRQGYHMKALAELLSAKPAEVRLFLRGQLATGRTQELHSGLLAAGIPL